MSAAHKTHINKNYILLLTENCENTTFFPKIAKSDLNKKHRFFSL